MGLESNLVPNSMGFLEITWTSVQHSVVTSHSLHVFDWARAYPRAVQVYDFYVVDCLPPFHARYPCGCRIIRLDSSLGNDASGSIANGSTAVTVV